MNFKPLTIKKLVEFGELFPEYSFGELIYSVISTMNLDPEEIKQELVTTSDESFYIAIERAIKLEAEPTNIIK